MKRVLSSIFILLLACSSAYAWTVYGTSMSTSSVTTSKVTATSGTFTNISTTNINASGNVKSATFRATGSSTFANMSTTTVTATGNMKAVSIRGSGSSTFANISTGNINASGNINGATFRSTGSSTFTNISTTNLNGYRPPFVLAQSGVAKSITTCNAAITWTLAADPANGKTRITSSGAHGLTTTSNGYRLYISAWSGTGTAGFYEMTYVDGTNVDLTLTYDAGLGNPTVTAATGTVTLVTVTLPAGAMGANGSMDVYLGASTPVNSANGKPMRFNFGGTAFATVNTASTVVSKTAVHIHNRGSESSQISSWAASIGTGYGTTSSYTTASVNTANATSLTITAIPAAANEPIVLDTYRIMVLPGT